MYDDASFYTSLQAAQSQNPQKPPESATKPVVERTTSTLLPPMSHDYASEAYNDLSNRPIAPPAAAVPRRANSHSDFFDIQRVNNGARPDGGPPKQYDESVGKPIKDTVETDLDFAGWYASLEDNLHDSAQEGYRYISKRPP